MSGDEIDAELDALLAGRVPTLTEINAGVERERNSLRGFDLLARGVVLVVKTVPLTEAERELLVEISDVINGIIRAGGVR